MQVRILRRWGSHQPGAYVNVNDVMGRWLVEHNHAEEIVTVARPAPAPAPPASDGSTGKPTRTPPAPPASGGSAGTGKRPARHRNTGS